MGRQLGSIGWSGVAGRTVEISRSWQAPTCWKVFWASMRLVLLGTAGRSGQRNWTRSSSQKQTGQIS